MSQLWVVLDDIDAAIGEYHRVHDDIVGKDDFSPGGFGSSQNWASSIASSLNSNKSELGEDSISIAYSLRRTHTMMDEQDSVSAADFELLDAPAGYDEEY